MPDDLKPTPTPTPTSTSKLNNSAADTGLQPGIDAVVRPGLVVAPVYPANLVKADPTREYVAGGVSYAWLSAYAQTLPPYIDDLTQAFGPYLYEGMMKDAQVSSNVEQLKLSVMTNGITLTNKIENKDDPKYTLGNECADFCRRNLNGLKKQSIISVCSELLDGIYLGHKVAEKNYYYNQEEGDPDKGKLCLQSIKVKDNETVGFVMDAFNNLVGILGVVPGMGFSQITQGMVALPLPGDLAAGETEAAAQMPPNLLPTEKFVIFTFRSKNGDPRGRSILRPAYDPWWCKNQVKVEYLKYLGLFAVPGLVGTSAEEARDDFARDENGVIKLDETQNPIVLTPVEAMKLALEDFKNGGIISIPFGASVTSIEATGDGTVFDSAFSFYNKEIEKGITGQTLATSEGQHNARAASQTHENTLEKLILSIKNTLIECIKDILYWLLLYNYGKEAADTLCPEISLAETATQDFAANLTAVAAATTAEYLHDSQYEALDAQLGLPPRDMEAFQADKQAKQDLQQKSLEAKANQPVPAPGQDQPPVATGKDQNPTPTPTPQKEPNAQE